MGITRVYNRILRKELNCRAAWPPIANSFELGDFGLMSGGVFVRFGNIQREFGVAIDAGDDSPAAKLDFVSESARIGRIAATGEVDVFPETSVDARLVFDFSKADSLVLKSSAVVTREMRNVEMAARALRHKEGWRLRFRVVRQLWHASHALIVSTREASTKLTLSGQAKALRQLDLGNVGLDIDVSSNKSVGLELVGRGGIIGLGLFRVRVLGGAAAVRGDDADVDRDDEDLEELDDDV